MRWEQRLALHAASGDTVLPQELKVKLAVSAVELAQETGLGNDALQYMLAVAGPRCVLLCFILVWRRRVVVCAGLGVIGQQPVL